MNRIYYPYSEFRDDLESLIEQIDQKFDTIIPIARGGLSISHLLGEYYNIRKVYAINTISYNDTQKLGAVKVFNIPNLQNAEVVLIVDDIVDSGDTLLEVLKVLKREYPTVRFLSASIFYKPTASIEPTWWVKEARGWIDFFWTKDL
jgi:xanthine phosphoribosyltransferase